MQCNNLCPLWKHFVSIIMSFIFIMYLRLFFMATWVSISLGKHWNFYHLTTLPIATNSIARHIKQTFFCLKIILPMEMFKVYKR